ncbi:pilus assembly protein CpaE [Hasllibacter halocynthiae]|uniref:Pilus assembly protein CpaE n=1 Tax=Hasllibacter halocynthiae TaxID=595589 RepID=A0A2T0X9M2_9RHOB|nr:AAA family ATPase [Hasllibacter halocynthiae]PRY95623.1 pilus assembly protein CpaE [Hasllibacter halocynthiae]
MTVSADSESDAAPIRACTISRDLDRFDALIDDMETAFGEGWGDLSFEEAAVFLGQPEAAEMEFVAIALDGEDEGRVDEAEAVIAAARSAGVAVILVTDGLAPAALHRLMKSGASAFLPYPIPSGELVEAIATLEAPRVQADLAGGDLVQMARPGAAAPAGDRSAVVVAVHGMAGGTGATTLAVNLASELATAPKGISPPKVALIDLDLQFGAVATALDLPRREAVTELLTEIEDMDVEGFIQALQPVGEALHVLTAPSDLLPLDLLGPEEIERLLEFARVNFDYVVIDLPHAFVSWTEAVMNAAHLYFGTLELDMRSAQNALRVIRALRAEALPVEKIRWVLNRAPKGMDLQGKARVKRMAESLEIKLDLQLPDGLKPAQQAADAGKALAEVAPKNPLRREIEKLAQSIHERNVGEEAA